MRTNYYPCSCRPAIAASFVVTGHLSAEVMHACADCIGNVVQVALRKEGEQGHVRVEVLP